MTDAQIDLELEHQMQIIIDSQKNLFDELKLPETLAPELSKVLFGSFNLAYQTIKHLNG